MNQKMKQQILLLVSITISIAPLPSVVNAFSPVRSVPALRHESSSPKFHSSKSSQERAVTNATDAEFDFHPNEIQDLFLEQPQSRSPPSIRRARCKRKIELTWCNHGACMDAIREQVVGEHNHLALVGPATGQVVYSWEKYSSQTAISNGENVASPPAVLMLVKREETELSKVAADVIAKLIGMGVQVLVDTTFAEELQQFPDVDMGSEMIRMFDPKPVPGFGTGGQLNASINEMNVKNDWEDEHDYSSPADLCDPDLIVTLGGDGLLMYASHVFSGPVPPILPVAGGSMGFLTPFAREEMLDAILISLGLQQVTDKETENDDDMNGFRITQRANNNMLVEDISRESYSDKPSLAFGRNGQICISMRMRLDCRIFGSDGTLRSRYNVLNEVVIDRGSSPYLASLECFCDDVHLTTVQADGIIFATPTGSTAYSMAAGGSVVHPAVPSILVTPICPHVLSFRSMIFPDHVVLRCYVPSDARSTACVYFDGKHRTELQRGDSVQIEMSAHPVPTINRADHSSDWLSSLKRNFNFNTRVRQNPLR
ncbi:hypothetical protein HJC23_003311 [Cyclotella cryptica]|uniref:NAD(+) kinase n=1 Tax=Cyclotella cryptica TaxID=29204 RepID=A0ABD3QXA3_9STRA|eukprot:CCRYP_000858-RA/>CCRYP_000858-RA protein AED:0.02 eAED:0.02 QI:276/1/1/1/1/1/2/120/541